VQSEVDRVLDKGSEVLQDQPAQERVEHLGRNGGNRTSRGLL